MIKFATTAASGLISFSSSDTARVLLHPVVRAAHSGGFLALPQLDESQLVMESGKKLCERK